MSTPVKVGSDNQTEDYFLELVINKHIIDREIEEILEVVDASPIHPDYQVLIKKILFGEKNLYLENWGTLATGLLDIVSEVNVRGKEVDKYGIVLGVILRVIEEVFDVNDAIEYDFLFSEGKEDIEHRLIILIKRVADFIEEGLRVMLAAVHNLDSPIIDGHIPKEYDVIRDTLHEYPHLILDAEGDYIRDLKSQVDAIVVKIGENKKKMSHASR